MGKNVLVSAKTLRWGSARCFQRTARRSMWGSRMHEQESEGMRTERHQGALSGSLVWVMFWVLCFCSQRESSCCGRNSEMRQKLRKKSEDFFKWEIYLLKRAERWAVALHFSVMPFVRGIQLHEWNSHWEGGVWGSHSLIFILALPSRRKEGFLSFLALIKSVTVLVHDGNFYLRS